MRRCCQMRHLELRTSIMSVAFTASRIEPIGLRTLFTYMRQAYAKCASSKRSRAEEPRLLLFMCLLGHPAMAQL